MPNEEGYGNDLESEISEFLDREEGYCITYHYGDGGAPVYVKRVSGHLNARRAALYCEFKCEEWFGSEKMLTNLGIGSLLVTFYGFQHHSAGPYEEIDMYFDRAAFNGETINELLADTSLHREKLHEYMAPHVIP